MAPAEPRPPTRTARARNCVLGSNQKNRAKRALLFSTTQFVLVAPEKERSRAAFSAKTVTRQLDRTAAAGDPAAEEARDFLSGRESPLAGRAGHLARGHTASLPRFYFGGRSCFSKRSVSPVFASRSAIRLGSISTRQLRPAVPRIARAQSLGRVSPAKPSPSIFR